MRSRCADQERTGDQEAADKNTGSDSHVIASGAGTNEMRTPIEQGRRCQVAGRCKHGLARSHAVTPSALAELALHDNLVAISDAPHSSLSRWSQLLGPGGPR